jgi:uncharacterized membrane protein YkvA (DUF1232 family)
MGKPRIRAELWLVAAVIYVICPLDFDFVPIAGWVDDVFVAYGCIKNWRSAKLASSAGSAAPGRTIDGTKGRIASEIRRLIKEL